MNAVELNLDYFLIYNVNNQWVRNPIYLQTQFDMSPDLGYLLYLDWFANPVSKNGEPIYDKKAHLASYRLYQNAPEPMREVVLDNQFDKQKIIIGNTHYLLAPAMKIEKGSKFPKKLDHYKVFQVLEGKPIDKEVKLVDQFGKRKVVVGYPYAFAAPAEKRHEGRVYPIQNKKVHLVLYKITTNKVVESRKTYDQFGNHPVYFQYSFLLAVPSIKLKWREI